MAKVLSIGELLIDFAPVSKDEYGYPTIAANPGGAPANFLTPLAKYGISAGFIGKVGSDSFGKLLVKTLNDNGIDTSMTIVSDEYFTTLAFVTLDENGDRSFSFARKPGADTQIKIDEIDFSKIDECDVLHFGSVSLTDNPSRQTCHEVIEYALAKGKIISCDPNLRVPLWADLADAKKEIEYSLSKSHIVKISDNEVEFLYNCKPEEGIEKLLNDYPNIKILYVTCGKDGAYYATRKFTGFVDSLKGINVVDTTGAGDIFNGTTMYKLLSLNKDLDDISEEELALCVKWGCVGAGLSTTKFGGISSVCDIQILKQYL